MMNDLYIKGGKELNAILQQIPVSIEQNILRSALRVGAKEMEREAKILVPKDDLDLHNSIRTGTRFNRRTGQVIASVKAGNRKTFYALMVEFGVAAHIIKAKKGGVLKFNGVTAKQVMHSGFSGKPFMRPAYENKSDDAVRAVARQVKKKLTKAGIKTPSILLDGDE